MKVKIFKIIKNQRYIVIRFKNKNRISICKFKKYNQILIISYLRLEMINNCYNHKLCCKLYKFKLNKINYKNHN